MRARSLTAAVLALLSASAVVLSYDTGPPDKRTGAPGETTCAGCHFNLNVGGGSTSLQGPTSYLPGDTLSFKLFVSKTGQQKWGFELTVLDSLQQFAGSLVRTDTLRTQLSVNSNGRTYLKQTLAGTDNGTLNISPGWQFKWVAPASNVGTITLYACGNATDGSGDPSGDYCYTLVSRIVPQSTCCTGVTGNVDMAGIIDLSDLSLLVLYVTSSGVTLPCPAEANVDAKGVIDITDISTLVLYLIEGNISLPSCPG